MPAAGGSVLVRYQGAPGRRAVTSPGWYPAVACQMVASAWQVSVKGRVADRAGYPVAGLPGAGDLFRVFDRDLDGPSRGVALDDLSGACVQVGGDQGNVEASGSGVADEDDLDRLRAEGGVPQATRPPPSRRSRSTLPTSPPSPGSRPRPRHL
jgi:hypothetical protein